LACYLALQAREFAGKNAAEEARLYEETVKVLKDGVDEFSAPEDSAQLKALRTAIEVELTESSDPKQAPGDFTQMASNFKDRLRQLAAASAAP